MKSIFTLASVAMLHFCANAQPVIHSSNVSPNFNAELYYAEVPTGFSPGNAGPNQTWNFSSIGEGMLLGTQTAVPVVTSPYAAEFPLANYCYNMDSAFSDEIMYFYHSLTPTIFEIYSLGYAGEVGEDFRQNPRTYVTFPYTYGTIFNDTYQRTEDPAPVAQTVTYDAYGTLIMPFGTFNNVVRQKVVTEGHTNFAWFNVNPFYPILQTALEDGVLGFIIDNTVLAVDDAEKKEMRAYPNPVADRLYLSLPDSVSGIVTLEVTDLSGKTMISGSFQNTEISVDTSLLASGIYFVKVSAATGDYFRKIVKS